MEGKSVRYIKFALIALALIFVSVGTSAIAEQVKTIGGSGYGPYQTGIGGEFTLQVSSDLLWVLDAGYVSGVTKNVVNTTNTFQTFCIEKNEYISPNTTYDVGISGSAKNGGIGGAVNNEDPVSVGTAWLYSQFAKGNLAGYDYTNPGRSDSATASAAQLQNAIWMLENETGYDPSNSFIQLMLTTNNWTKDYAFSDANGAYGVEALNMGVGKQDQLVMTSVPEPSFILFLGIAMVGIAIGAGWLHKVDAKLL